MSRPASRPVRVLFVIPGDGQGSSMIFVRRQAASLAQEGIEVECFYLHSRTSPRELARAFPQLRRRIREFQPSLIHAHFGTVTAALAALAAGKLPLVITYRGGDLNRVPRMLRGAATTTLRGWAGRLLSQLAALRAAGIVCVSQGLRERLWWRRSRVTVLPSGVDGELFHPEPRPAARARLHWSGEEPVVLFNAGHNAHIKRLDLAEQSAAVARQFLPGLRLEVLRGDTDPGLVPTFMNASDCLLITSDSEGSPTVLQEALACALPVVSVAVGDAVERLRGVRPSRIVSRDPQVIGRALAELAGSPERVALPECVASPEVANGPGSIERLSLRFTARALCAVYREALGAVYRDALGDGPAAREGLG
jgi:teichuronic acid biosynthesis glycosyltransferase TuaC